MREGNGELNRREQLVAGSSILRWIRKSRTATLISALSQSLTGSVEREDTNSPQDTKTTTEGQSATAGLRAGSQTARLFGWIEGLVRNAWLYRWLTAEPDPDVIVIDLRETWTVGPILSVIDRGVSGLASKRDSSRSLKLLDQIHHHARARPLQLVGLGLGTVAFALAVTIALSATASTPLIILTAVLAVVAVICSRLPWSWETLQETRGYQALAAAFEPPEPPERRTLDGDETEAGADSELSGDGEKAQEMDGKR